MAKFIYQAKAANGQIVSGDIEAANQQEAIIRLRAQQLTPLKVNKGAATKSAKSVGTNNGLFAARVKSKDLQIFTRQFATLINAGIPVVDALKILSEGLRPGLLREASTKVKSSIEQGKRLADSMAQVPAVFDKLYVNMIQAGEEAGILDGILHRLAIYMEKSEKIKGQVKGALFYPILIIIVAIGVITGILVFILPKFMELFTSSGQEPPALTQMVINLSNSLIAKWYIYISAAVGGPYLLLAWIKTPEGKKVFDKVVLQIPIAGEVVKKSSIARLTRTLSTLLSSGVGLMEAIDIAAKTSGNAVIEESLMRCKESVSVGRTFAAPLYKEKAFPDMVVQMISIGEKSGTLDIMLGKIADFYEDEVEAAVKGMTSLLEPILMVFLGGIIAVLVLAMYLPIFNMGNVVGQ